MNAHKNKSANGVPHTNGEMPMIVFFGTDLHAVPVLRALTEAGYPVQLIVTKPDEPVGRHQTPTASPVKLCAEELQLPLWQPEKFDTLEPLKKSNARIYVVVAYGKLLPGAVLTLPALGVTNIHPSLLPRYRGPSPVQTAILNGDTETGVTIMLLNEGMDSGPLLAQKKLAIGDNEKAPELSQRLFEAGARLLIKTLPDYINGAIIPQPQDETQATYCSIIKRENGLVDWRQSANAVYNKFRAFTPWPGIFTFLNISGKQVRVKLLEISAHKETLKVSIGTLISNNKPAPLALACLQGFIQIHRLQMEGGKPLTDEEFLNGFGAKLNNKSG